MAPAVRLLPAPSDDLLVALEGLYQDLHANPELSMQEHRRQRALRAAQRPVRDRGASRRGIVARGQALQVPPVYPMVLGTAVCIALRMLAIYRGWRAPVARWGGSEGT